MSLNGSVADRTDHAVPQSGRRVGNAGAIRGPPIRL
jgi:hypothetical protein